MCDFTGATFREGLVVSSKEGDEQTVELTTSDSRELGKRVFGSSEEFENLLIQSLNTTKKLTNTDLFKEPDIAATFNDSDRVKTRFSPGLIIDFRSIYLADGNRTLDFRSCLTVCSGKRQSKIWTRCSISAITDPLMESYLSKVREFAHIACHNLNSLILKKYQDEFIKFTGSEKSSLESEGRIIIDTYDCSGPGLDRAILDAKDINNWSGKPPEEIVDIVSNGNFSHALSFAKSQNRPFSGATADSDLLSFQTEDGKNMLHFTDIDTNSAYIYGIIDTPASENLDAFPNSIGASAELASFIGSAY